MATPRQKSQNDFNPDDLIKASADHEKTLAELSSSVKQLEKRVGDSTALAKSFKEAFDINKNMDTVLRDLLCELIKNDDQLKDAVKVAVKKIDRDWWGKAWKTALGAIGAVLLVVLGAVLQSWLGS